MLESLLTKPAFAWVAAGVIAIASCSGDDGEATQAGGAGGGNSGDGSGASGVTTSGAPNGGSAGNADPVFETDILPIFEMTCGASDADCHRREAYVANAEEGCRGWAALENAAIGSMTYPQPGMGQPKPTGCSDTDLYERLINIPGWTCGPPFGEGEIKYLVVPCDPDASLIIEKIEKTAKQQCIVNGKQMDKMPPASTIDSAEARTLRDWIANGAPTLDGKGQDCGR
jgi:hypothetical protein